MSLHGAESDFELATIQRLEALGYRYAPGGELDRALEEVVLRDLLRDQLARRYPGLTAQALAEAVARVSIPEGADTLRRNMAFHDLLTRGFDQKIERPGGRVEHVHVHPVDWDDPENNDFLVVNQLSVHGKNDRRPDLVVYVNDLPQLLSNEPRVKDAEKMGEGAL